MNCEVMLTYDTPVYMFNKFGENSSSYLQNAGRFSKTFTADILVQTAKYCLPQIKYLLIHVFLINFRQGNVKLVLLKEFKPIILDLQAKISCFGNAGSLSLMFNLKTLTSSKRQ
jgi:hypothetical protein